ncbi:MAG: hypothetical protein JWL81_2627, partial [Verrucomicrobiales bacterium]|nr:hypothetical protein [Verrucomicrobiales bacterium]
DTATRRISHALPVGVGATDLTINHQEGKLYVTNWRASRIQVIDLNTLTVLSPIVAGLDVYKLNAGRAGRLYAEGQDQWVHLSVLNSVTGATVGDPLSSIRAGDGETDPTGRFYYHSDSNISSAYIVKYTTASDVLTRIKSSPPGYGYGSRNLVMSPDGTRLFWQTQTYDSELNLLRNLGEEVYSTTQQGELAITAQKILNADTGAQVGTLPVSTTVSAVCGDQSAVCYFNPTSKAVGFVALGPIFPLTVPGTNFQPAADSTVFAPVSKLSWDMVPSAVKYRVYFGTDAAAVAAATGTSGAAWLGETVDYQFPLPALVAGNSYFWRVDPVGVSTTTTGVVRKFTVSPLVLSASNVEVFHPRGAPERVVSLTTSAAVPGTWAASESLSWLTLSAGSGASGQPITATFNTTGLAVGQYSGKIDIVFAGVAASVPVRLEIFDLGLTKMIPDPARPFIYGLHPGTATAPSGYVVFINSTSRVITHALPAGYGATDLTLNNQEGRIYVSSLQSGKILVIDAAAGTFLTPLPSASGITRIAAGKAGRLYLESQNSAASLTIVNSATGAVFPEPISYLALGDGRVEPTGRYYYHASTGSNTVQRYNVSTDRWNDVKTAGAGGSGGTASSLVMSPDGQRFFWGRQIVNADLVTMPELAEDIVATTQRGELAFSAQKVYNPINRLVVANLPVSSTVTAVSGDQSVYCYFNAATKAVGFVEMSTLAPVPPPGTNGQPAAGSFQLSPVARLSWDVIPSAIRYRVYFGTDAAQVAAATTTSAQYLGEAFNAWWDLAAGLVPLGGQFYYRIDAVGLTATTAGTVIGFRSLPVSISPVSLETKSITGAPIYSIKLPVAGAAGTAWTAASTGTAWLSVGSPTGVAGELLDVRVNPAGLAAGVFTGNVTLSSGGGTATIPVKLTMENPAYVALLADPTRPRLYALQRPANLSGSLVAINTDTNLIERVLPLTENPTGFDITADGQYLYAITRGARRMHRVNLNDWSSSDKALGTSDDHSDPAVRYRVAAGAGTKVYWTDGEWAPRLHTMDFATGLETGTPLLADPTYGFGDITRNAAGNGLSAWTQYGWSAGIANSQAVTLDTAGASATFGSGGVALPRDPLDTPLLVRADGSAAFVKKHKLSADLTQILQTYPAEVYAVSPQTGIVFGATQAWRERTMTPLWQAPVNVSATVSAVAGNPPAFFYWHNVSNALARVNLSTLGDFPGPSPEDGEVLSAMPATLTWTPNSAALGYKVYFGTDPAGVLNAAGQDAPYYLGSADTSASIPLGAAFRTGGIWWWRVDTVLAGQTVKGAVQRFSGALEFLGLNRGPTISSSASRAPSIAMEGTTILTGYPSFSADYSNAPGQVLVHDKKPGMEEWERTQKIDKPAVALASASANFGAAIAIKNGVAWISAPLHESGGRLFEYRRDTATRQWTATGRTLQSPSKIFGDEFGASLSFDGNLLLVSSPGATVGSYTQAGAVEIFDAATLVRQASISETAPSYYSQFGKSAALGDGFIAIASPNRTVSSVSAGGVDIWTRGTGTTWTRTAAIPCPFPATNRGFGYGLTISGNRLFIGTAKELSDGRVFVYQKGTGTSWTLLTQIPRAGGARTDTSFSSRLAATGDLLAVGNPSDYSSYNESDSNTVWLHRSVAANNWPAIAPALPGSLRNLQRLGVGVALTNRYVATLYQSDNNAIPGFTVHLHDPNANLAPYTTSSPTLFAEVGKNYQYTVSAYDENAGDLLTISPAAPLPSWLTLSATRPGQALLSGTPPSGSAGNLALSLRVQDAAGDSTTQSFTVAVLPAGGIPEILTTSGDVTSDDGKPLTLSVIVGPGAPVSYQWYQNGIPLGGRTGATLPIGNIQASDAGSYHVRVTRGGVWVDSAPMVITVNQVPDRFGGDWPTFGANTSHTGTYPATLSQHKFLSGWTIPQIGNNPVVTGGGKVYTVQGGYFGEGPFIAAHAIDTGAKLWSASMPTSFGVNPPTYHRGKVYMQRAKGTNDTPDLRCYDGGTGTLLWKSTFGAQWENYFAPTIDDTGIYVNGGSYGGIYKFGLDGTEVFFQSLSQFDSWTPLLHQGKLYSWVSGAFINHDLSSGAANYMVTAPWDWRGYDMNTVPAAENGIAVMRSTTEIFAVDLGTRRILWRKTGTYNGSPAIKNGNAYFIGAVSVETYDARTGNPLRTYPTRDAGASAAVMGVHQPIVLEDTLLVSSETMTWVFDLATGTTLQRLAGGGPLTYSDGTLFAVGTDSILRTWKVNQPTRLTPPTASMAATEDVPFTWDLQVTDPDADVPALTFAGLPSWLAASPLANGMVRFSGTPLNAHNGSFSINVTADDKKSFTSSLTIAGSVTPVNDNPIGSNHTLNRLEDAATESINLTAWFTDEESAASSLRYSVQALSNPDLVEVLIAPLPGSPMRLVFKRNAHGSVTVTVRGTDPEGLFADSVLTFNVASVNDLPAGTLSPLVMNEDAPPVILNLAEAFADIETPDSGLTFRAASGNPALVAVRVEGSSLTLLPAADAFGSTDVSVVCTDADGGATETVFSVRIDPVNDAPVIPFPLANVSAGGAAADQVIDFSAYVADADTGDQLTWRVVSNTAPGLFTQLSFDASGKLTIKYAPYAAGSATITVEVTDASGAAAQRSFTIDLPSIPEPVIVSKSALVLNRQTGLWEQKITVRNAALRAIPGFEVTVSGLPAAPVCLYNASDLHAGHAMACYHQPVPAGGEVTLTLEYYTPTRGTLSPVLAVAMAFLPETTSGLASTTDSAPRVVIDRISILEPGAFLLEFPSVPGQLYQIQYAASAAGPWTDSLSRIRAAGTRVQWIDRGAPRTSSPPGLGGARFYRVKSVP